jgi:hypothetical protein
VADVHLHPRLPIGKHQEIRLAETANRENAPADPRAEACRLQLLAALLAVLGDERLNGGGRVEPPRIRIDAELLQRLEVGAPLDDLI